MTIEEELQKFFPYWTPEDLLPIKEAIERAESGKDVLLVVPGYHVLKLIKTEIPDILERLGGKMVLAYKSNQQSSQESISVGRSRTVIEFLSGEGA